MHGTTPPLCSTFHRLAHETYSRISRARAVDHQPLEETFTDLNALELKTLHPTDIHCRTFTKPQEGRHGADWEWWLTDKSHSLWLGVRVQAKLLHLKTNRFAHLHYKPGGTYQTTKLIRAAQEEGMLALYCLYTDVPTPAGSWRPLTANEDYGCSLVRASDIQRLRRRGGSDDFVNVMSVAMPWQFPFCMQSIPALSSPKVDLSLPELAAIFLGDQSRSQRRWGEIGAEWVDGIYGLRRTPPDRVLAVMRDRHDVDAPPSVRGMLIIRDSERFASPPDERVVRTSEDWQGPR
jgi:hypothetical protein